MPTIKELTKKIVKFRDEREWAKYHTPKNLVLSLLIELGELAEHFQWQEDNEIFQLLGGNNKVKEQIKEEIADVAIYLFLLANELGIDLERAILEKIKKNEKKYPVEKVTGSYVKYTELREK